MKAINPDLRARIEAVLRCDHDAGTLVMGRSTQVSRSHYAAALGVSLQDVCNCASTLFASYDSRVFDALSAHVTKRFDEDVHRGLLPIRAGKVCREWFRSHAGVRHLRPGSALQRLAEDLDQRVRDLGYLPPDRAEALRRLSAVLEADCPLAPSRRHIALEELSRRTGISRADFLVEPFFGVLREKRRALAEGRALREGDILCKGKVRPFSILFADWPRQFVLEIGPAFKTLGDTYSDGGKSQYQYLVRALNWLAHSSHPLCMEVRSSIHAGQPVKEATWDGALQVYRDEHCHQLDPAKRGALDTHFSSLNVVFEHFAAVGILPRPLIRLTAGNPTRASEKHTPSVAEVSRSQDPDPFLEFSSKVLRDAAEKFKVEYGELEAEPFLQCLGDEAQAMGDALPSDIPTAVRMVVERRLALIKTAALAVVDASRAALAEGRALLGQSTLPSNFVECVQLAQNHWQRGRLTRAYFPHPKTDRRDIATSNFLALVQHHYASIIPSAKSERFDNDPVGSSFFHHRLVELGSRASMQRLITPTKDAVAAVVTMCQVDTGMNVSVALGLLTSCMRPSEARKHTEVVGHKDRAGGKAIVNELPTNGDCIKALTWLLDASAPLRRHAEGDDASRMFLKLFGDRVTELSSDSYRELFKSLIDGIPELRGLRITPSMLRPSVLMKVTLENDGRMLAGLALGQHGEDVGNRAYQSRAPVRQLRAADIGRFQYHYESVIVVRAAEIAPLEEYTSDEIVARQTALVPTGLGTFCKDRFGRPGHEGERCTEPNCAGELCPQIEVVLTPVCAAQMQVWKASLERVAPDWERDREERWLKVWLPWLCLLTVVQEKASRGPLLCVWDAGTALRVDAENQPGYQAPCPW